MRQFTDVARLQAFMAGIGRTAKGPGRIYIVGGSTALLLGLREQTVDIDIKLDPEPEGVFEAIAELKESLGVNVELSAPDDFLPAIPGWQDRSEFIGRWGQVDFYHYDFYGQALAKISRGHGFDLSDARALVRLGKVTPPKLRESFERIRTQLVRFPGLDGTAFEERVASFCEELDS